MVNPMSVEMLSYLSPVTEGDVTSNEVGFHLQKIRQNAFGFEVFYKFICIVETVF